MQLVGSWGKGVTWVSPQYELMLGLPHEMGGTMESTNSKGHPALTDVQTGLPNALHWDTVFGVVFAAQLHPDFRGAAAHGV